jgi:hypothetical protein
MSRAFLVVLALISCGGDAEPVEPTLADLEAAMAGYEGWAQLAPWEGVQPSEAAHGAFVQIWWNDTAEAAIAAGGSDPMPAGSLIVKEGYGSEDTTDLNATTVMWKVEEYGWFWARFDAAGEVTLSGQPGACVECHAPGDDEMLAGVR